MLHQDSRTELTPNIEIIDSSDNLSNLDTMSLKMKEPHPALTSSQSATKPRAPTSKFKRNSIITKRKART